MDVIAAAKALNQKAMRQSWHHYCDPTLSFRDTYHDALLQIWRAKAGQRSMPARADMTPRDLKDILRHIVIFQRDSQHPSRYSWRLIGTKLTEIGGHVTGKTFEESIPPEHVPRWVECCDLLLDGGQPLRFLGRVHIQGREYLDAENLFVPLANDNGVPSFVMGLCRYTPHTSGDEDPWENEMASIPGGLL